MTPPASETSKSAEPTPQGAAGDPVFAGVDPALLSVYTKRVFARIGIPDASFHTLRHTAASWLVQAGTDLYAVGQILGHKTPRMTHAVRAAIARLHGGFD